MKNNSEKPGRHSLTTPPKTEITREGLMEELLNASMPSTLSEIKLEIIRLRNSLSSLGITFLIDTRVSYGERSAEELRLETLRSEALSILEDKEYPHRLMQPKSSQSTDIP